jgi:hypothetical protein
MTKIVDPASVPASNPNAAVRLTVTRFSRPSMPLLVV